MGGNRQSSLEEQLAKKLEEANVAQLRETYVTTDDLDRLLCSGKPGTMLAAACERREKDFKNNPDLAVHRDRLKHSWRRFKERIFEATIQRIKRKGKLTEMTRRKLEALAAPLDMLLQDSLRTAETLAQAIKIRKTPYAHEATSTEDTMETSEMLALEQAMEQFNALDTDELVDMIFEDQVYIDMVIEERNNEPGGLLDKQHKDYWKHLDHLIDFIQGKTEADSRAKSEFRKQAEAIMWQEIVRGMEFEQKLDLIAQFIKKEGPAAAKNFIAKSIIVGAMSRRDVSHMVKEGQEHPETYHGEQFAKLGEHMDDFLRTAVQAKDVVTRNVEDYVRQIEKPQIQNAIQHFVTFDKLIGETIGRLGALTALLNFTVHVCDGIVSRKSNELWVTGALQGVKNAMTDKYVIGGVAAAAIGSNIVWPWIEDFAYAPSKEERERLFTHHEEEFFRDQAENHHEVIDYFVENFNTMRDIAQDNSRDPTRNSEDLWIGDLKEHLGLTDAEAHDWGYEDADRAEAALIRMFTDSRKVFKTKHNTPINNDVQLVGFLKEHGWYGDTHNHSHEK